MRKTKQKLHFAAMRLTNQTLVLLTPRISRIAQKLDKIEGRNVIFNISFLKS